MEGTVNEPQRPKPIRMREGEWVKPLRGIVEQPDAVRNRELNVRSRSVMLDLEGVSEIRFSLDSISSDVGNGFSTILLPGENRDMDLAQAHNEQSRLEIRLFSLSLVVDPEKFIGKPFPYVVTLKVPTDEEYTNKFFQDPHGDRPAARPKTWLGKDGQERMLLAPEIDTVLSDIDIKIDKITPEP